MDLTAFLTKNLHWLIVFAGVIFTNAAALVLAIKYKIPNHEERIKALEAADFLKKTDLINHEKTCQRVVCNKIDSLKKQLEGMDKERDAAKADQAKQLESIHYFMGRVDQWMQDHGSTKKQS